MNERVLHKCPKCALVLLCGAILDAVKQESIYGPIIGLHKEADPKTAKAGYMGISSLYTPDLYKCPRCGTNAVVPVLPLIAKFLHVTEYPRSGWGYTTQEIKNPSWQEIESAIRRLDKYCFPFIWIFLTDNTEDIPDFQIIGGKGDYWMSGNVNGYNERRYSNPSVEGEDREVCVWESDQGFSDYESTICHDLEEVLQATRYLCEHGDFDPSVSWEEQERAAE